MKDFFMPVGACLVRGKYNFGWEFDSVRSEQCLGQTLGNYYFLTRAKFIEEWRYNYYLIYTLEAAAHCYI